MPNAIVSSPRRFALFAVLASLLAGAAANGQGPLYQWNFNDSTTEPAIFLGGTSSASVTLLGGTTATFAAGTGSNGANSTDPVAPGLGHNMTTFADQGTNSGTAGVRYAMPTNIGAGVTAANLVFRFDQRNSGTSSFFSEVQYTLNGTTWLTFAVYGAGGVDSFLTQTFDLSGISGAANNAHFAVRTVAVFDPSNNSSYTPTNGAGTYGTGGTIRHDMVTLASGIRWQGGNAGGDIAAPANYVGSPTPAPTDILLFGTSANTTVNVATSGTYGQLLFQGSAPAYTVNASAGQTLTLSSGIVNNSTATQTINTPVAFTQAGTIQTNGPVILNGAINIGAAGGLQLGGTGTTVINATYTGNDITLSSGRTLAGIGLIQNEVHNYGGTVRGGFSDGTNNFGTLRVAPGSGDLEMYAAPGNRAPTILIEATRTGSNAVNNSRIALTGGASIDLELNDAGVGSNLVKFNVVVSGAPLVPFETYAMTILTTDSIGSIEFNNVGSPDLFIFPQASYELLVPGYQLGAGTQIQVVDVAGASTLVVTFTPVPEPASLLTFATAVGATLAWVRRRRRHFCF